VGHNAAASAAQLEELLEQVADCRTRGHRIRIKVGQGVVERQGERLAYTPS
jgi:tRNA(Ile)-lysidine synthase